MSVSKEPSNRSSDRLPSNARRSRSGAPGKGSDGKPSSGPIDGSAKVAANAQESEIVESEQCAKYLKALADPARIRILKALQTGSLTGTDLSNLLDIEIPNVSHHLRVLYHAGIVKTRRDGRFIYYEINGEVLADTSVSQTLNFGCCSLKMS